MVRRVPGPPGDLEALDPTTGRPLGGAAGEDPAAGFGESGPSDSRSRRDRRLRALRLFLVVAALAAGTGAVVCFATVQSLRAAERTWQTAMAIDATRANEDARVAIRLAAFDSPADPAIREQLDVLGRAEDRSLARLQQSLRTQRILDDRTARLRDSMVRALEFRYR